jgi:hypothetical protein
VNAPTPHGRADEGSIVLGWLTKLVVGIALLGFLVFDGIALLTASLNAADHANTLASNAADSFAQNHNLQAVCDTAAATGLKNGDTVTNCQATANGHVTLTVHRTATTLWMHRIGFLKKYTEVSGEGEGAPAT